jgi:hypothetical protein
LAAALRSNSEVIVTYNGRDFPRTALLPYSITALGPSAFLTTLYNMNKKAVIQVLQEQAAAINKPVNYVLDRLRINAPHFVEMLSEHSPVDLLQGRRISHGWSGENGME